MLALQNPGRGVGVVDGVDALVRVAHPRILDGGLNRFGDKRFDAAVEEFAKCGHSDPGYHDFAQRSLGGGHRASTSLPISSRAITSFWICGVPSPIMHPETSRNMACSGISSDQPTWPCSTMQSRIALCATSGPHHLSIAASLVCGCPAIRSPRA